MRRNVVRKTTESKYVDVSAWPSVDGGVEAARPSKTMEQKYATDTPDDTCRIEDS
jgi:hypothetical protein